MSKMTGEIPAAPRFIHEATSGEPDAELTAFAIGDPDEFRFGSEKLHFTD